MKKDILKTFGNNLRAERNRLGISQDELASKAELSDGRHISKIENGEVDIRLTTLIPILKTLNIKFEQLYDK